MIERATRIKVRKLAIAEKESDSESSFFGEIEVVYVVMKDDSDEDTTALVSYVNKDDKWIIDSGCSHHRLVIRVSSKLLNLMMGTM